MKPLKLWSFFCRAGIILGAMFVVFFRLGRVNPAMEFIGGGTSKGLLLVFCLRAITNGAMGVPCIFTKEKAQKPHHERKKESDVHEGHYG